VAAVRDPEGLLLGFVGCCVDLTARKLSEERYRELFEYASDAIFVLSVEGDITAINGAGEKLTGYGRDELVGRRLFDLIAPENVESARETFQRRIEGSNNEVGQYQMIRKGGARVYVEVSGRLVEQDGRALGVEAIARDKSERRAFEQKLVHEAMHDALTGLPNRTLFRDRLGQALSRATRSGSKVAVMLLDLDEFKRVNDSLGHEVGDELLVDLAARLRQQLRGSDSAARLGGDEFAFLFENITREQQLVGVARRLLDAVAGPEEHAQRVTASLGITIAESGDTADTALSNADSAMYKAKAAGPGGFVVYDEAMRERLLRELALTEDLAAALQDRQLDVHYQPIVGLTNNRILAVEALTYWNHPQHGSIEPSEFIPLAEDHGLIVELGHFVLGEVAKQAAAWRTDYPKAIPLGVFANVSSRELCEPDFVDVFRRTLEQHGTSPRDIGIEITERVIIDYDEQLLVGNLDQLTKLGVSLSLDDFGTGYSSLTALKNLPLTAVKIDRSFIGVIQSHSHPAPVTRATISLGHTLGLTVIAEGVETQLQADYLTQLGCDAAQGFHYARPHAADHITTLLQAEDEDTTPQARQESVATISTAPIRNDVARDPHQGTWQPLPTPTDSR
jgi:diguanylate cyclase (GGDEF)-like protein/PAS domain S-box-containing protein